MNASHGIGPANSSHSAPSAGILDRQSALEWYRRNRARSAQLFDMLSEGCYFSRPIALRNPIVFYEGHLPGFSVNTLIKKGLGRAGVDAHLEEIFARGIDPEDALGATPRGGVSAWPDRHAVRQFADACDRLIEHALLHDAVEQEGVPVLERAEGVFTMLEHEAMPGIGSINTSEFGTRSASAPDGRGMPSAGGGKHDTLGELRYQRDRDVDFSPKRLGGLSDRRQVPLDGALACRSFDRCSKDAPPSS